MALARDEEEEREGGGRGEPRGHRHHQQNHTDGMGPVGEIWLEFDGYRETSLKMFPVEHQHVRSEKGERDILSREKVVMPSQEEFGRERSSSSLQREEEEIEGRSGFFRLLGKQQEQQEEELSPAFMEYLGRSKSRGYLRHSSDLAQGYLRGSSEVAQGYSRSSSEEKGKHDSLTPAFHHYLGSVIHRHSNSSTGSEDSRSIRITYNRNRSYIFFMTPSRPSLSPEVVWLSPSSPSSSSILTLEDEEDEDEDNISFIFIEQSKITHRLSLSLSPSLIIPLYNSTCNVFLCLIFFRCISIYHCLWFPPALYIPGSHFQVHCLSRSTREGARDLRSLATRPFVVHCLLNLRC